MDGEVEGGVVFDECEGLVELAEVADVDFVGRGGVGWPVVEPSDEVDVADDVVVVEFGEVGVVDAGDEECACAVGVAGPEVGASLVAEVEVHLLRQSLRDDDLVGGVGVAGGGQVSADEVACEEGGVEGVVDAFEDDALYLAVGFEHTAFGGGGLDVGYEGQVPEGVGLGRAHRDVGVVVVGGPGLAVDGDVCSKAGDFVGDVLLEAAQDADGHNHNDNAEGDGICSDVDERPREVVLVALQESLCYKVFVFQLLIFNCDQ